MATPPCDQYICSSAPTPPVSTTQDPFSIKLDESKLPMNSIRLGQATWPLLHKMALRYPRKPSQRQKQNMLKFINSFSWMFPCSNCARDFRQEIKESTPGVESRESLSLWFCRQHNRVNKKLGKPEYLCEMSNLELQYL